MKSGKILQAIASEGLQMTFEREKLPDPANYYEAQGLTLQGAHKAAWKTTRCEFHGGSDSMRINLHTGAFVCMAGCGAKGGDVLAYERAVHGIGFVEAAKRLGAWSGGSALQQHIRPTALTARDGLSVLADETELLALEGSRMGVGIVPSAADLDRIQKAAARIRHIREIFT